MNTIRSVSRIKINSNAEPRKKQSDAVLASQRKRKLWRPDDFTKDRPGLQEIYVPSAGLTCVTELSRCILNRDVRGEHLNNEMPDNDCRDVTPISFRDFVYLSRNVRSPGVKTPNSKTSNPNRRSNKIGHSGRS